MVIRWRFCFRHEVALTDLTAFWDASFVIRQKGDFLDPDLTSEFSYPLNVINVSVKVFNKRNSKPSPNLSGRYTGIVENALIAYSCESLMLFIVQMLDIE